MTLTVLSRMVTSVVVLIQGGVKDEQNIYVEEPTCFNFSHQIIPFCLFSIPLIAIAMRFIHITKVQRDMREITMDPNFYLLSRSEKQSQKRISIDMRKTTMALQIKNMFHLIFGLLISVILMLCFSSEAVICVFEEKLQFISIIVKVNLIVQIIVQSLIGLGFLYFTCIVSKFVKNYLPSGLVAKSSLRKMKALFITLFISIFIRTTLIWLLVFDVFSRFDKELTWFGFQMLIYSISATFNFTEIISIVCFITILIDAKRSQIIINEQEKEDKKRKSTHFSHNSQQLQGREGINQTFVTERPQTIYSTRFSVMTKKSLKSSSRQKSGSMKYEFEFDNEYKDGRTSSRDRVISNFNNYLVDTNQSSRRVHADDNFNDNQDIESQLSSVNESLIQFDASEFGDDTSTRNIKRRDMALRQTAFRLLDQN
eukprot:403353678